MNLCVLEGGGAGELESMCLPQACSIYSGVGGQDWYWLASLRIHFRNIVPLDCMTVFVCLFFELANTFWICKFLSCKPSFSIYIYIKI